MVWQYVICLRHFHWLSATQLSSVIDFCPVFNVINSPLVYDCLIISVRLDKMKCSVVDYEEEKKTIDEDRWSLIGGMRLLLNDAWSCLKCIRSDIKVIKCKENTRYKKKSVLICLRYSYKIIQNMNAFALFISSSNLFQKMTCYWVQKVKTNNKNEIILNIFIIANSILIHL